MVSNVPSLTAALKMSFILFGRCRTPFYLSPMLSDADLNLRKVENLASLIVDNRRLLQRAPAFTSARDTVPLHLIRFFDKASSRVNASMPNTL